MMDTIVQEGVIVLVTLILREGLGLLKAWRRKADAEAALAESQRMETLDRE